MKNSNDTIENRSRDLPVCSAVPKPMLHRVPLKLQSVHIIIHEPAVVLFTRWFGPRNEKVTFTLHECSGMTELVREPDRQG
jgi:hypothetical protein